MSEARQFDVVVIGAGPAGLAAALTAYTSTSSVALINDAPAPGGQIWRREASGARDPRATKWIEMLERSTMTVIDNATVVDAWTTPDGHRLLIERDGQAERVAASRVILATGARELFLPFPGWVLPGVLGVGGAQAMAKAGFDVRGKRIVVAGTGPLLIAVAASLAKRGARIVAVVEQVSLPRMAAFAASLVTMPGIGREAIRYGSAIRPWVFRFGSWVASATGDDRVRSVTMSNGRRDTTLACDLLCVGYGLTPNSELGQLLGCAMSGSGLVVDRFQQTSIHGVFAAGECCGIGGVDAAFMEGVIAGYAAVGAADANEAFNARDIMRRWGKKLESTFALRSELLDLAKPDTVVCRCEDVRLGDIDSSWTARQAKLYTRIGMGPCQGRVCGSAMQRIRGWTPDRVRAPIYPSFLSTLAEQGAADTTSGAT